MAVKFKTVRRINEVGHAHSLTFSCYRRLPLLQPVWTEQLFVDALIQVRCRHRFDLWAYVVMPEHVHLLIFPTEVDYSISTILAAIKRSVAYHARRRVNLNYAHFWQPGGGYDRNMVEPKTVHHEILYIHNNPVRRGLCNTPGEYYFSSAACWAGSEDVPIKADRTIPSL